MKCQQTLLFVVLLLFFLGFAIAEVSAKTDNYPAYYYFGYGNGTYFTHPGTYGNVTEINHVWYFDDVAYPSSSPSPSPSPSPTSSFNSAVNTAVNSGFTAMALFAIVPIISVAALIISLSLMSRDGKQVGVGEIVISIVLVIAIDIIVIVGVLILSNLQNALNTSLIFLNMLKG